MAAHVGDGSSETALLKATDVCSNLDTASALLSTSGLGMCQKPNTSAAKAGIRFVIPKNKLSGALVPVVRNVAGKCEPNDMKKEHESKSLVPQRKTKWGPDLTQDAAVKRGRALALQTRAEQIAAQLESGQFDTGINEATRSPSPPPIYDSTGQRTNTREGRRKELLELERREAIGECMQLNPLYKPPSGYKPVYKEAKLYIPVKDYPGYNFIGLILGPRGNTQKRMEAETGSRIAIRGKGAVKEGKKSNAARLQGGRRDCKEAEGAFEDLHVHITADSVEKVDAAVALVEPLLTPVDEDRNTHKRKQLRELAEMNGTMRDYSKACTICGETGHREWHCPKDKLVTFQAKVDCQICGDGGHPTIDCPRKHQAGQAKVLDKEYLSFLEELGDGLAGPTAVTMSSQVTKLGGEDISVTDCPPGLTATTRLHDDATMLHSATSLDPNQLADVISRPHPSTAPLNQPQHISTSWPPSNFIHGCEDRSRTGLQQGVQAQTEVNRQFPVMFQANPVHPGFNMTSGNFTNPGFLHASDTPTYQGRTSFTVVSNMEGLQAPQNFHAGPDRLPATRSHFYGNVEARPESPNYPVPTHGDDPRRPCKMQVLHPTPPEISQAQASPWNQIANTQTGGTLSAPIVWECNQYPQPQANWTQLQPQPPITSWQMAREQGWKEGGPAMPPTSLGHSPPWEVTHKPWEASCPWNASCLPKELNHPWLLTQQRPLHFHAPHPAAPKPGSGHFTWRGGPAPQSFRMPLPVQSGSIQPSPSNLIPRPYPPHRDPLPPWHSRAQSIPDSYKSLNNPVASQFRSCSGTSISKSPASWAQPWAEDLCPPHARTPTPSSANAATVGSQSQVNVLLSSSVVGPDVASSSNPSQIQPAGVTQTTLPKTDWNQPMLDSMRPPRQISTSAGQDSKSQVTTPVPGSPVEVDSEYEKLMVSVGVT